VVALVRPDSWNVPLLLHMLGAMVLVGVLLAALSALLLSAKGGEGGTGAMLRRLALRALLFGAIPAYVAMRVGAQWMYSKEFPPHSHDPTWVGIGFIVSDLSALVLIATCIVAWRATKRATAGGFVRAATILTVLMLIAYVVALWAMSAKPS
jgi:hypothetical protein